MRILFDHNVPSPLRRELAGHEITFALELGWDQLKNGRLLAAAEESGFELLLTADKGFLFEQNMRQRKLAVLVLSFGNWPDVRQNIALIMDSIAACQPGQASLVPLRIEGRD